MRRQERTHPCKVQLPTSHMSLRMTTLLIPDDVADKLVTLADTGDFQTRLEVAAVFAELKLLREKLGDFWNIGASARGTLSSHATLESGTSIWRLCPTHTYCIALLTLLNGDLHVLDICSEAEVHAKELEYR